MSSLPYPIVQILTAYHQCNLIWRNHNVEDDTFRHRNMYMCNGKIVDIDHLEYRIGIKTGMTARWAASAIEIYLKLRRDEFPEPLRATK